MSSWYEAWADRYAEWSAGVTADVPFYVALAREADGLLVELAVSNGRVAIPVAQATGRRVVGIDSSPAMLAQARERAVEAGVELDLREGDIRELELEEPAAMISAPAGLCCICPSGRIAAAASSGSPHRFDLTAASLERVRLRPSDRIRDRRSTRRHTVAAHDPLQRQR
jgi:SAM-dependent methyltransferase